MCGGLNLAAFNFKTLQITELPLQRKLHKAQADRGLGHVHITKLLPRIVHTCETVNIMNDCIWQDSYKGQTMYNIYVRNCKYREYCHVYECDYRRGLDW
jgi:hypothetical protein